MSLTPLEVENMQFGRSLFGGYDRSDVERFLAQVSRSLDEYVGRIDALQRQVQQLESELRMHRENEDLLRSSVVHAQRSADELVAAARQRAESIKGEAELEAGKLRHSLADLRNEREQFEFAFHGMLTGFIRRLEHSNPALTGVSAQAVALPENASAPLDRHDSADTPGIPAPVLDEQLSNRPPSPSQDPRPPAVPDSTPVSPLDEDAADFAKALNRP